MLRLDALPWLLAEVTAIQRALGRPG
jgi:hypothetical protein